MGDAHCRRSPRVPRPAPPAASPVLACPGLLCPPRTLANPLVVARRSTACPDHRWDLPERELGSGGGTSTSRKGRRPWWRETVAAVPSMRERRRDGEVEGGEHRKREEGEENNWADMVAPTSQPQVCSPFCRSTIRLDRGDIQNKLKD
ncbi:hypothetical protein BS78_02G015900 [Paspalum vaginatum]|nr:hypothetical protein BS78_02G015900 [Paspalum vaginatum]